jgi:hypothetical protein
MEFSLFITDQGLEASRHSWGQSPAQEHSVISRVFSDSQEIPKVWDTNRFLGSIDSCGLMS